MKYLSILVFIYLLLLPACSSTQSYSAIDDRVNYSSVLENISNDAAGVLAGQYAPGHTAIHVIPASEESALATCIENALREKGFTIQPRSDVAGGKQLSYIADFIDSDNMYLSIKFDDGYAFSVFYRFNRNNKTVQPAGSSFNLSGAGS